VKARYRIQAFSALTGVTVKALLHYDRLGLLRPPRTASGHRIYTDGDRERLEQIVALKFLGLPLKQVRTVLQGQTLPLCQALRAQREALTADRTRIDRAIQAIERMERAVAEGRPSDTALLHELTSSLVRDDAEDVRHYFSDAAWAVCQHWFGDRPAAAWQSLFADISASLDEDPSADREKALLWRMHALLNEETGRDAELNREVAEGMRRAWYDRDRWPASLQERLDGERMREIRRFMARVSQATFLKYGPHFYGQRQRDARSVA